MFYNYKSKCSNNQNYSTPEYAIRPLLEIIPKDYTIWESCCGEGNISKFFEKHGYKVISTDIITGQDFFTYSPEQHYDIIITNPPFKLKDDFIERCIQLNKPFMLLLPLSVFESPKRIQMLKQIKVTIFMLPRRVNYINSSESEKKSKSPFYSIWIGANIPNCESNHIYYL